MFERLLQLREDFAVRVSTVLTLLAILVKGLTLLERVLRLIADEVDPAMG